ncbi:MAG TPA: lipid-A-disaccharide synthase N-terminal domain-containing protein [Bacteroidota bacterium]|nr:lipid-A-disaccharide synthase N-terminal domain-containing protein [Bacteroidota bacterium]
MTFSLFGYLGLSFVVICWLPQTIETLRAGRCGANTLFLILSAIGSICLVVYAVGRNDLVFSLLNSLTAIGALVNLYYKFRPRSSRS